MYTLWAAMVGLLMLVYVCRYVFGYLHSPYRVSARYGRCSSFLFNKLAKASLLVYEKHFIMITHILQGSFYTGHGNLI